MHLYDGLGDDDDGDDGVDDNGDEDSVAAKPSAAEHRVCIGLALRFKLGLLTEACVKLAPVASTGPWAIPAVKGVSRRVHEGSGGDRTRAS